MKKKFKIIIYVIILLLFISLSLIIGYNHEPWADEAHAWMIARDTNLFSLFFKYLHTDGHPALWHLILKSFQLFGLPYRYFFIIPIIFSSIGVAIFIFKSKFPLYIKLLFPFSYFIFYQYTIVARGYCLLLPIISLIACIYNERHQKCYLFTFLLILLMNTEAYTYILAGCIFICYLYEFIKNYNNIKNKYSHFISLGILGVLFILTVLYVYPINTNTFLAINRFNYYFSDSFFTTWNSSKIIKLIFTLLLYVYIYICYCKSQKPKNFYQFLLFLVPVLLFYELKYYSAWHLGIVFIISIFCFWIHNMHTNKMIISLLLFTIVIQISWSISSCTYDYNKIYSPASNVATFIQKFKNNNIYGLSFNESAINPYFKNNIFKNWKQDISFFYWNTQNKFYQKYIDENYMLKHNLEIVIVSKFYRILDDNKLKNTYNIYEFKGATYFENSIFEDQTIKVYILKTIDV